MNAETKRRLNRMLGSFRVPVPDKMKPHFYRAMRRVTPERVIDFNIGPVPISINPTHIWVGLFQKQWFGFFLKRPRKDIYNPRRWGGFFLGIEIGCRG